MGKDVIKEDIYIAIAKSAMTKMPFLFSEDNKNAYFHNGREYREYDVPVFIALSGFAHEKTLIKIFHQCVMQMQFRGFNPDPDKLNRIIEIVKKECQDEIYLVKETDRRFSLGESSSSIYNDIKDSLKQQHNSF